ncbi:MAG: hypothetical protein ABIG44_16150 [Planctomycetota bacterium]
MMSLRVVLGLVPLLALMVLTGCARDAALTAQQSRVIASNDPDHVLLGAAGILRRELGRVHLDMQNHSITTDPVEYTTDRESGTARDLYHGRSTMRRQARCSVRPRGSEVVVQLRIDIERRDTARTESMQSNAGRFTDSPSYTPIERDAATTTRQNTVWTFIKRDRRLERAILAELSEQYAPPLADTAAAKTVAEESSASPADNQP